MFAFGIIGYVMRKLDIAIAPMLLSFVLAKILEESLRRGLVQSDGNILAFFERPITAVILSLTVLVLIAFAVLEWRRRRAGGTQDGNG